MLLVIADTSPIRYLVQIGQIGLLQSLFESVSIPLEAATELGDASAPVAVRSWMGAAPDWLSVRTVEGASVPGLSGLDAGERSAIVLGIALQADLILIDERKGAAAAISMGLETTGTLGVLDLAARRGLIDIAEAIDRLKRTNFRYRPELLDKLLAEHGR